MTRADGTPHLDSLDGTIASRHRGVLDVVVASFCALLLLSNIGATKVIGFGPILTDGGAFLFPLTYILGDVLSEVYGLRAARRAILLGFVLSVLASLTFWLVQISPPGAGWENQAAFEAVLGFVPRIVLASVLGYLAGQLLNAYVLVALKRWTGGRQLWFRLLGSTVVGQLVDTLVFATVAWFGFFTVREFVNYVLIGFLYKVAVEAILLPVTYQVIGWVRRRERATVQRTA